MQVIGKILLYTLAVIVVGCLLAPPLYWLGRWAVETELIPQLKSFKFPKYFNRAMLVVALASIWPFLRWLGLRQWQDLGLARNPRRLHHLALGLVVGIVGLWAVAAMLVLTDHATLKTIRMTTLLSVLATAIAVPLIEETFFRGALFGLLRRALDWRWALAFLSLFFAVLHFIKPPSHYPKFPQVHWYSGFELLPRVFWQFAEPDLLLGRLLTLFLVGWLLGYTVVRTRSLYLAMGLHGGWVFALRSFTQLSKRRGEASLFIGDDITTGLVPVLLIVLTLVLMVFVLRDRESQAEKAP